MANDAFGAHEREPEASESTPGPIQKEGEEAVGCKAGRSSMGGGLVKGSQDGDNGVRLRRGQVRRAADQHTGRGEVGKGKEHCGKALYTVYSSRHRYGIGYGDGSKWHGYDGTREI